MPRRTLHLTDNMLSEEHVSELIAKTYQAIVIRHTDHAACASRGIDVRAGAGGARARRRRSLVWVLFS